MDTWKLLAYRGLVRVAPRPFWQRSGWQTAVWGAVPNGLQEELFRLLKRHRAVGASVALFNREGVQGGVCCGLYTWRGGAPLPVKRDTVFRIASVTKHITAMAVLSLARQGMVDPDADTDRVLPYSLRHPAAPERAVTLRRLMSHTAGIHDGQAYLAALTDRRNASELLGKDCFASRPDGFEYSNFGAGLAGCVLEAALKQGLETIFQSALFAPLGVQATFIPQRAMGPLADSYRIFSPRPVPAYDGYGRQHGPEKLWQPDPERNYVHTQGNLCISAENLARLGSALLGEEWQPLRQETVSFGRRDPTLWEGLGTFILRDSTLCGQPLYGHQGLAYGAVHGLWYDPEAGRGVALLTSGCSLAREHVVADINKDLIRAVFGHGAD